jgi:DNA-binding HxlR family transcriptional regulator
MESVSTSQVDAASGPRRPWDAAGPFAYTSVVNEPASIPRHVNAQIEGIDFANHQFATALDLVGDRWVLLVLREAFQGVTRFDQLQRRTGAPRSTLTDRLRSMTEEGILYRNPYQSAPRRFEYRLTGKGLDLYPAAAAAWQWETRWSAGEPIPPRLLHTPCGQLTHPVMCCETCGSHVAAEDCQVAPGRRRTGATGAERARSQRRSRASQPGVGVDQSFFHVVDVVGDRWTALVFCAALFGLRRYDDFQERLGIATNILADRLRVLTEAEVLERNQYLERPQRYEYRLTAKGLDLFSFVVLLSQWAERWLAADVRAPVVIRHGACGQPLRAFVACGHCGGRLLPSQVGMAQHRAKK